MDYGFPLESKNLAKYDLQVEGEEQYKGYDVYRISSLRQEKTTWEGEALIDAMSFSLSRHVGVDWQGPGRSHDCLRYQREEHWRKDHLQALR